MPAPSVTAIVSFSEGVVVDRSALARTGAVLEIVSAAELTAAPLSSPSHGVAVQTTESPLEKALPSSVAVVASSAPLTD